MQGDNKSSSSVSAALSLPVLQLAVVTLTASANPALTLDPVTLSVVVANSGVTVPNGVITFTDGSVSLGSATLDATGHATLTVPSLTAATHTIVASLRGRYDGFRGKICSVDRAGDPAAHDDVAFGHADQHNE